MYVLYQLYDRATQLRSLQAQPAAAAGWAWCSSPAPHDQPHSNHCACFTTGPAPQGFPHTAATPLQIFLKWEYSFQGSTTQSSSRAAPPRRPEFAAGTAQALSPNSSLLSPPHWRAKAYCKYLVIHPAWWNAHVPCWFTESSMVCWCVFLLCRLWLWLLERWLPPRTSSLFRACYDRDTRLIIQRTFRKMFLLHA